MASVLGIAAYYHDSSATLVVDGEIIAAAQEERFTRKKHDASFPSNAVHYCLDAGKISLQDIDAVIFYDKPLLKFERLLETFLAHVPKGFLSFLKAMPIWLKEKLYLKSVLRNELHKIVHKQRSKLNDSTLSDEQAKDKKPELPRLLFSEHHQSHAASAFYPSPFEKAVILCVDGVGEWATTSVWLGEGRQLTPLKEIQFPHSLGLLYSAFTYYCGFRVNSGEYKLMGLAPYGNPVYVDTIYRHLVSVKKDGSFSLNMAYFDYPVGQVMTNRKFEDLFAGPALKPDSPVTQKQMDLARSIQVVTEEILLRIVDDAFQQTGVESLCLAGGVALNCVANGRIQREGPFNKVWIQPAAGDAGGSLGAALLASNQYFNEAPHKKVAGQDLMAGSYLGPEFNEADVLNSLQNYQLTYSKYDDEQLFDWVADLINKEQVIGWFQGRMEFGPRALGNRSIIGDARSTKMQSIMNLKIKKRESFRPFAPAVLAHDCEDYFVQRFESPYMLFVSQVNPTLCSEPENSEEAKGFEKLSQIRSSVPAITHVDYSARVQTVHQQTNPRFHKLISAFKKLAGCGLVINTSFNQRGEPPVCSPDDAIQCFLRTEMDYLVMGNIILDKKLMPETVIERAQETEFTPD